MSCRFVWLPLIILAVGSTTVLSSPSELLERLLAVNPDDAVAAQNLEKLRLRS